MNKITTLIIILLIAFSGCSSHKKRIHLIGDSTMADYEENVTQMRGWGEMFRLFVPEDIIVIDHAKPGRSSRSFYDEGRWNAVKQQIVEGDVVLIQFAHNDEKEQGKDGADGRGTAPWSTYRSYLKKYINETRRLGATPILVQPIVRRYFDGNSLSARGCHNIGCPADSTLDYTAAMRCVAVETEAPVIDLCSKTRQIVEAYGPVESKNQLYVQADNTHTSMKGAALFALAVAEILDTMDVWEPGTVRHPQIVTNPSTFDFGEVFIGDTVWQTFDVIDFDGISTLTPKFLSHRECINIIASDGVKLSSDLKSPLVDSLSVYTNCGANVIVHYSPRTGLSESMKLKVETPSASVSIPIKARGRMLSRSETLSLQWANVQVPQGNVELSAKMTAVKGLVASPDGFMPEDGHWPAEIDENGERYVQLTLTAGSRCVKIKNIAIRSCGAFSYRMSCAFGKDFYRNSVLGERQHPAPGAISLDSFSTSVVLRPAQSLLVRVYPWSNDVADNVKFSFSDVDIRADVVE